MVADPLFEPLEIGGCRSRNRIVALPLFTGYARPDGGVTPLLLEHYWRLAASGAGLVVVANVAVSQDGRTSPRALRIDDDRFVPELARLAATIRHRKALACVQLNHAGRFARTERPLLPAPFDASHLDHDVAALKSFMHTFPFSERFGLTARFMQMTSKWRAGMTPADRDRVVADFGRAARRAVAAGFDMLELHGATGYLLAQFLSAFTNRPPGPWAGDFDRRVRFVRDVVQAVRQAVPEGFPIGYRLLVPRDADHWVYAYGDPPDYHYQYYNGATTQAAATAIAAGTSTVSAVDFLLEEPTVIRGTVRAAGGAPLGGVDVSASTSVSREWLYGERTDPAARCGAERRADPHRHGGGLGREGRRGDLGLVAQFGDRDRGGDRRRHRNGGRGPERDGGGRFGIVLLDTEVADRQHREDEEHDAAHDLDRALRQCRAEDRPDDGGDEVGDRVPQRQADGYGPQRMTGAEPEREELCLVAEFGDEHHAERDGERGEEVDHRLGESSWIRIEVGGAPAQRPRWSRPGRTSVSSPRSAITSPRLTVAT